MEGAGDLKRKWTWAVEWLHDELERGGGQRAPYANTASSNETANGYFLERSHSARLTLEKACELMPEEEGDAGEEPAAVDEGEAVGERDEGRRERRGASAGTGQVSPGSQGKARMRRREDDERRDLNNIE